jgi:hypothetical protein
MYRDFRGFLGNSKQISWPFFLQDTTLYESRFLSKPLIIINLAATSSRPQASQQNKELENR